MIKNTINNSMQKRQKKTHIKNDEVLANQTSVIEKNYNHYFSTGIYQSRYPSINRQTFSATKKAIDTVLKSREIENITQKKISSTKTAVNIIDYGCGEGRYLCHLLSNYPDSHFTAYDISSEPLRALAKKLDASQQHSRVTIIHGEKQLKKYTADRKQHQQAKFSIGLLLFGVLSHIPEKLERKKLLTYLRDNIDENNGQLILSVPNKKRRFSKIQRDIGSHEITYTRIINHETVSFYYHLYSVASIQQELNDAGLELIDIQAESLLPESWVTKYRLLGWFDYQLCRFLPPHLGYGILIRCRVKNCNTL